MDLKQDATIPTSLSTNSFKNSSTSLTKLLNGDKNYHNGNYCIILGSNVSANSNSWFCGKKGIDANYSRDYYQENIFNGSSFIRAYELVQAYAKNNNCAMLTYFDIETASEGNKCPTIGETLFPFDYKWTEQQEKDAEKWNDDYDTNYKIKKNHYARNDKSAKDMRSLVKLLHTLFGDTCKDISAEKLPFLMVWKKGVPQKSSFVQLNESTDFNEKVINVWEKDDEEEEKK